MDGFYEWMLRIIIFLILSSILFRICDHSMFLPYLKLVSGFLLLIIILEPLNQGKLWKVESVLEKFIDQYDSNEIKMSEEEFDELRSNMILQHCKEEQ